MKTTSSYLDSHLDENFEILEVGLRLIPEQRTKIRKMLQNLEAKSPTESYIKLLFKNQGEEITGTLSIISPDKIFKASASGSEPPDIYKSLDKEINQQLLQWKKHRFKTDLFGLFNSKIDDDLKGGFAA